MKRHLLWAALVVSLIFNVTFGLGYLVTNHVLARLQTPEGRVALVADQIGASEELKRRCQAIERQRVAARQALFDAHGDGLDAFYAEAIADEPDSAALERMIDEGMVLHRQMLQIDLEHFLQMAALMTPEQRRHLAAIIRRENLFPGQ